MIICLPFCIPPRVLIFLSLCLNQFSGVTQHLLILPSSYQINHKVLATLHSVNLWIRSLKIMSLSSWSCLLFLHSMNHSQGRVSQHALVEYGNYSIYRSWIFLIAYRLTIILLTQQRILPRLPAEYVCLLIVMSNNAPVWHLPWSLLTFMFAWRSHLPQRALVSWWSLTYPCRLLHYLFSWILFLSHPRHSDDSFQCLCNMLSLYF